MPTAENYNKCNGEKTIRFGNFATDTLNTFDALHLFPQEKINSFNRLKGSILNERDEKKFDSHCIHGSADANMAYGSEVINKQSCSGTKGESDSLHS